ncbi:hypothetical protein [Flavobacterium sp.]|uniref:hypothetical protein n=1 Tax=Flavobacterium sp. TaxID=239 RepID=UPI0037535798
MALILFSCSPEDNTAGINQTDAITNQLTKDLKLDQFKNQTFANNLVVNWESIKKIEKDGVEIYEIEVEEKNPTIIKSNLFQSKLKYALISIKKENQIYSYLIEIYSGLNHPLYANSIQKIDAFTGTLNVYELYGKQIDQLVVINGKSINPYANNALMPLNDIINRFHLGNKKTASVPVCYLSEHVYVTYSIYTDHYYNITVGTITEKKYAYTTIATYTVDEPMSVPCGESESSYETYKYVTIRNEIIDNVLDPCDRLKTQNSNPDFKAKIDLLKKNTGLLKETGVVQKADGTFLDFVSSSNPNYMTPPAGTNFKGGIHVHINPYPSGKFHPDGSPIMSKPIPIFSPQDIKQFLETLLNTKTNTILVADVYSTMVSSSGTYTLKFTGNIADINTNFNWGTDLDDKFKLATKKDGNELGFLLFLKDNIGIKGITLYKVNDDGTSEKKSLDAINLLQTTPCQ